MNYLYGQVVPPEEVDEMLSILKAIEKHQKEMYLLTHRAMTMCPTMMDGSRLTDILQLLNYKLMANHYDHEREIKRHIEQLTAYKQAEQETP